jgi:beta-galactosidase
MKPKLFFPILFVSVACAVAPWGSYGATSGSLGHTFVISTNDFLLDGKPFQIRCGEIHAPRVPREYWRHRLQMARAIGLNTVCAYLFWNLHEPEPGHFNWSGQADAAAFCRIAQEEGLGVILRPGPYACAEWEMGGLPWWLLKHEDIRLRTRDPRYLAAAQSYLREAGRVLGPLQITKGGPIFMVQVENEYGFFGKDAEYMGAMRQALLDAGLDVPLFACNPPNALKNGYRPDLFPVVNFGSDPAGGFRALRAILPQGPPMCGEFYPGWFDTWGAPHHTGKTDAYLRDLEYMLKAHASFSIYMAHGGTTFGLWSGCDRPFKPDTSSYDYDAPITEAGWTTEKFFKTRELFANYLLPGETIPEAPPRNPVIAVAPFELRECAPILANLPMPVIDPRPRSMEMYNQGYGCILYRTELPAGPAGRLEAAAIHDFGYVFCDGRRIGITDRRNGSYRVGVPARTKTTVLDLLVEPMGRVNFGPEVHDRKGIRSPVNFTPANGAATELTGWSVFSLPLDAPMLGGLKYGSPGAGAPAFWRGHFRIAKPGDTFLDLRLWGKGVVWVNGHCLGRFWNIGPTQTAYAPGPWLKPGENEVIVLDLLGPEKPQMASLEHPLLDQLRPQLDFARGHRAEVTLHLEGVKPVQQGAFAPGSELQEVRLAQPAQGRFFCLESLNAQDGKPYAAIAELVLLGADGQPLGMEGAKVAYVDSEERTKEDGLAENAMDGQSANYWHTEWSAAAPTHPHRLVLDLGSVRKISGVRYTPRQGDQRATGRIKDYRIYVGNDLVTASEP